MLTDAIFFYVFALTALVGAILTITRSNAVHSALSLIVSLIGVAGLFLLQKGEFLFAVQILLYIGGVTVLFLFVIMLVNLDEAAKLKQFNRQLPLAAVAVLAVSLLMAGAFATEPKLPAAPAAMAEGGNTERIADVLFSEFLVPFEAASLLLIVAVVGAVMLARKREPLGEPELTEREEA